MLNLRSAERWRSHGDVAMVLKLGGVAPRELEACLLDVSAEGIGLTTREPVALGAVVEVLMAPPAESVMHPETLADRVPEPIPLGSGRVVRTAADEACGCSVCGICFDGCDPDRLETLIELLRGRSLGYVGEI